MPDSRNTNDPRVTVTVPAPSAGAEVAVTSEAGGNLKFDFDPAQATASRPDDSNDLVFELDGGGRVVIGGFFEVGDDTLPDLTLPDGTVVAAADFFAGSDLDMTTAAGPGAGSPASGGTNYNDDSGSLIGGLDRLGSLGTDHWERTTEAPEIVESRPDLGDPFVPAISVRILSPEDWPQIPGNPRYGSSNADGDRLILDEAYLKNGTKADGEGGPIVGHLVYEITSNDALAFVTINGVQCSVPKELGSIDVSGLPAFAAGDVSAATVTPGAAPGIYYLVIEYTLDKAYGHIDGVADTPEPQDQLVANIGVSVNSVNGGASDTASSSVDVRDDVPMASTDNRFVIEDEIVAVAGNVLDNDVSGADGWHKNTSSEVDSVSLLGSPEGKYGSLILNADGSYTYNLHNDDPAVQGLTGKDGETPLKDTFTYQTIDSDGDIATATLVITITGANALPTVENFTHAFVEDSGNYTASGNALTDATFGDDVSKVAEHFKWAENQSGEYGKITLNPDGTYTYEMNNKHPSVQALTGKDGDTQEITLNLENSEALNYTAEQINTDASVQAEILQHLIANLNS